MNRQQRRAAEKQRRQNRIREERELSLKECEAEIYYNVFAEQLNEEFGFGKKRIQKAWAAVDRRIGEISRGEVTKKEIEENLINKTGVVCRFEEKE